MEYQPAELVDWVAVDAVTGTWTASVASDGLVEIAGVTERWLVVVAVG